jgi:hypothetical protein
LKKVVYGFLIIFDVSSDKGYPSTGGIKGTFDDVGVVYPFGR